MRIISIKNKKKLEITYAVENNSGEYDERVIRSGEQPRPEFYKALQALAADAHWQLELPELKRERIYLTGIKFNYYTKGSIGVIMEGSMLLETVNLYQDFKTYEVFTLHPGKEILPEQVLALDHPMHGRIAVMQEEIKRFIKGERAQQNIFNSESGTTENNP